MPITWIEERRGGGDFQWDIDQRREREREREERGERKKREGRRNRISNFAVPFNAETDCPKMEI